MQSWKSSCKQWYVKTQKTKELVFLILSIVFSGLYACDVLIPLPTIINVAIRTIQALIWLAYIIDYGLMYTITDNPRKWFVKSLPDLLSCCLPHA